MKKLIFSVVFALSAFFAGAATRLTLENGINIVFEGCADGSVRFEALGKKPSAPVKEFELSREAAADDFVQRTARTGGTAIRSFLRRTATPCFLTVKNCMRRLSTKNLPFCVKYVTGKLQLNSTDLEKQAAT